MNPTREDPCPYGNVPVFVGKVVNPEYNHEDGNYDDEDNQYYDDNDYDYDYYLRRRRIRRRRSTMFCT